jgi:hypothetical protein
MIRGLKNVGEKIGERRSENFVEQLQVILPTHHYPHEKFSCGFARTLRPAAHRRLFSTMGMQRTSMLPPRF